MISCYFFRLADGFLLDFFLLEPSGVLLGGPDGFFFFFELSGILLESPALLGDAVAFFSLGEADTFFLLESPGALLGEPGTFFLPESPGVLGDTSFLLESSSLLGGGNIFEGKADVLDRDIFVLLESFPPDVFFESFLLPESVDAFFNALLVLSSSCLLTPSRVAFFH